MGMADAAACDRLKLFRLHGLFSQCRSVLWILEAENVVHERLTGFAGGSGKERQ